MILLKTLIFTVLVPGTVLVYLPWIIMASAPPSFGYVAGALRYLAIGPFILGAGTYCWSAWDFASKGRGTPAPIDAPKSLVAQGPYRYVRNPMYVGALLIILGESVWLGTTILLLYGAAVFTMFHLFIILYEEPTLRRKFGEPYGRYRARVPRWIPRSPGPVD